MRKGKIVIYFLTLLLSISSFSSNIQHIQASGTIYIRGDGSVERTDKIQRDGDVYTFVDNIYDGIVVEKDNIVVDGVGYTLQGTGNGMGIDLTERRNVTIKNTEIKSFNNGIYLRSSHYNTVSENSITNNSDYGIYLYGSRWNMISGNNVTDNNDGISFFPYSSSTVNGNRITNNRQYGIYLNMSTGSTFRNNDASNNTYNFGLFGYRKCVGICGFGFMTPINDVDDSNTVNGKPIYYWIDKQRKTVPSDAGYVVLVDSKYITVQNLKLTNNGQGILLFNTINSTIIGNNITNNDNGIYLHYSHYNMISGNSLTENNDGIHLDRSDDNTVYGNSITNNNNGMHLASSRSRTNTIYHNNFIYNNIQAVPTAGWMQTWDDGYPSGGNYWSDYVGEDTDGDGIGDIAYNIGADKDNYPLMFELAFALPIVPIADFTFTPSAPKAGDEITFNASSSTDNGIVESYEWDFGDDTTGSGIMIDHTYATEGVYTVTLTVTDNDDLVGIKKYTLEATPALPPVYALTIETTESNGTAIEGIDATLLNNQPEQTTTNATGIATFTSLIEGAYDVKITSGTVVLFDTTIYVNTDITVSLVIDSSPYALIPALQGQVTTLEVELNAQTATTSNNLYGGLIGGVGIGLVIVLAIMFVRK